MATPVTTPVLLTVAVDVLLLPQVPPPVALLRDIEADKQTAFVPVIVPALGNGFTVTEKVSTEVPHVRVTE
jgi:hypothetical protein